MWTLLSHSCRCRRSIAVAGLVVWATTFLATVQSQDDGADVGTQQRPAFENNDRFHNRVVQAKISDRFEIYNPHSVVDLQAIREMGFRQVILDWPNLHRDAAQHGLDVVIANWWTIDTEISDIEQRMEFVREIDPKRLAAISMMDEPERNSPQTPFSYYQALYGDLRKAMEQEFP
ncbi:MAG: hypothetical protein H7Z17_16995, partial [Fuerstia sp.]|nr:hypothetical protein [Fuerstiella sp.]